MSRFVHAVTPFGAIVIALLAQVSSLDAVFADDKSLPIDRLLELRPDPAVLGKKWGRIAGLVVEDLNDLSELTAAERKAVHDSGMVRAMKQIGATAVADYSYKGPGEVVPAIVTLRVIIFRDRSAAMKFWKEKYEMENWEKTYQRVDKNEHTLDVIGFRKRITLRANVLLTCHQSVEGDEYRKLIEDCLKRLENALTSS
jgi:hypothetical protein